MNSHYSHIASFEKGDYRAVIFIDEGTTTYVIERKKKNGNWAVVYGGFTREQAREIIENDRGEEIRKQAKNQLIIILGLVFITALILIFHG